MNNYLHLTQEDLDCIAQYMNDEIREVLHSGRDWQSPGEFLTAYLAEDPGFPIDQFRTAED